MNINKKIQLLASFLLIIIYSSSIFAKDDNAIAINDLFAEQAVICLKN